MDKVDAHKGYVELLFRNVHYVIVGCLFPKTALNHRRAVPKYRVYFKLLSRILSLSSSQEFILDVLEFL